MIQMDPLKPVAPSNAKHNQWSRDLRIHIYVVLSTIRFFIRITNYLLSTQIPGHLISPVYISPRVLFYFAVNIRSSQTNQSLLPYLLPTNQDAILCAVRR